MLEDSERYRDVSYLEEAGELLFMRKLIREQKRSSSGTIYDVLAANLIGVF